MKENAAQLLRAGHDHAVLKTGPPLQMDLDRVSSRYAQSGHRL